MSSENGGRETLFSRARRELPGPCCLALLFVCLAWWSWRKWPDILVDFGRELYVPWQLVSGSVLYRDIAYLNGPLSPYLNSLWFLLFGVSVSTLFLVNLAMLAVLTGLLYALFRRACDRLTATISSAVFLCLFGFAHLTMTGNYNFISPYSHELTHGILLGTFMILMLARALDGPDRTTISVAGFCLGLSFLTKPEIFLATLPTALVGLSIVLARHRKTGQRPLPLLGAFSAATLIPAAVAFALLSTAMPISAALLGVSGGWPHLLRPGLVESSFYRNSLGLDAPWVNLSMILRESFSLALFVAAIAAWSIVPAPQHATLPAKARRNRLMCIAASFLLLGLALVTRTESVPWLLVAYAIPLISLGGAILLALLYKRGKADSLASSKSAALLMWATFAFFLLAKILLHPRFHHYGFALAAPATVLLVALLLATMPEILRRTGLRRSLFRVLIVCALVFDLGYYVLLSEEAYGKKDYRVGAGRDYMVTYNPEYDPRGPAVNRLLDRIGQVVPRDASLVVLPEGVMVNYQTRRQNSTPYVTFMPLEFAIYDETRMLDALRTGSPDFIVLLSRDMEEYGIGPFGKDPAYGSVVMAWVRAEYESVGQIVEGPGRPGQFDTELLKRRAP